MPYTISPLGDSALLLGFGNTIDTAISQKVVAIAEHFKHIRSRA